MLGLQKELFDLNSTTSKQEKTLNATEKEVVVLRQELYDLNKTIMYARDREQTHFNQ